MPDFVVPLRDIDLEHVASVGDKNANLGALLRHLEQLGVRVPDGFAVTADAFREHLRTTGLATDIYRELARIDIRDTEALARTAKSIRERVRSASLPETIARAITLGYEHLSRRYGEAATDVAVRSSGTAPDVPDASFVGLHDTFVNVRGVPAVLDAVCACMASLFTERAIVYRSEHDFPHDAFALSVCVQKMVRSDLASAGVTVTREPASGFSEVVQVTAAWGLGESIVEQRVDPDTFTVHKPTLARGYRSIIERELGGKETKLIYSEGGGVVEVPVPVADRRRSSLSDDEVLTLARWSVAIENFHSRRLGRPSPMSIEWAKDGRSGDLFVVQARPEPAHARRQERAADPLPHTSVPVMLDISDPSDAFELAHLPSAGVGLVHTESIISAIGIHPMALVYPDRVSDPAQRTELDKRIASHATPQDIFVDGLATRIARIAAAFYPRPVVVRFCDFTSHEFAELLGGKDFEPAHEPNPLIGFRGAARYYDDRYRDGFALECAVIRRVRQTMGLTNVKVMVPFCRTLDEARRVLDVMAAADLRRGADGLEIYLMCEVPNNAVLANEFADLFDGFVISSHDLAQLVLGVDRSSELLSHIHDERDPGVRAIVTRIVHLAHRKGIPVGFFGQPPRDDPGYARFLASLEIDSISVAPDALSRVMRHLAAPPPPPSLAARAMRAIRSSFRAPTVAERRR